MYVAPVNFNVSVCYRVTHVLLESKGFTAKQKNKSKNSCSKSNCQKYIVWLRQTRQVLISARTVTFSKSSSLCGKHACNILRKCPTCAENWGHIYISCDAQFRIGYLVCFCELSEKEGMRKVIIHSWVDDTYMRIITELFETRTGQIMLI